MNIRQSAFLLIILFCAAGARAQVPTNAEMVRTLIAKHSGNKPKTSILFKSLVSVEGKISGADRSSFYLRFRTKGGKKVMNGFRYENVLYIKIGKDELNFLAPPNARPHGQWDDIKAVYPGTRISIVLDNKESFTGWFGSANDSRLIVLNESAKKQIEIEREKVAAFYGVLGRSGGIKSGASKGAKGMLYHPILSGVGAGLGAIAGGLFRSDGSMILVYSR